MGKAAWAGAGTAAAFLEKFVEEKVNWAHIDIAGMTLLNNDIHGIRAFIEYYRSKVVAWFKAFIPPRGISKIRWKALFMSQIMHEKSFHKRTYW